MAKIPSYAIKAIENGRKLVSNMDSPTYTCGGIKKTWEVMSKQEMPGANEYIITVVDHKEREYTLDMVNGKVVSQMTKEQEETLEAWFDELEKGIL
jgi:hypothetical protein